MISDVVNSETSAQIRETLLMDACDAVNGSREEDYGTPEDNFRCIGELWTAYLADKINGCLRISSYDVAMMQILLKVARNKAQNPSRDNNVDIAGYAAAAEDIRSKKEVTFTAFKEKLNQSLDQQNQDNKSKEAKNIIPDIKNNSDLGDYESKSCLEKDIEKGSKSSGSWSDYPES